MWSSFASSTEPKGVAGQRATTARGIGGGSHAMEDDAPQQTYDEVDDAISRQNIVRISGALPVHPLRYRIRDGVEFSILE